MDEIIMRIECHGNLAFCARRREGVHGTSANEFKSFKSLPLAI
jgi:hypothetical protein